jgi:predicted transcriptional regulator
MYSVFARYHYYSGNRSATVTLTQLFGDKPVLPSILFPPRLNYFSSQLLNEKYTADYFIQKHTVLPYYLPFIADDRANKLIEGVKEAGGHVMYLMSGMAASNLFSKDNLFYCPLCIEEDIKTTGEPFFHRSHQLEGIMTCHKHGCYLKAYKPYSANYSKARYIRLTKDMIDNPEPEWPEKEIAHWLNELALISKTFISVERERLTFGIVSSGIRTMLDIRGYRNNKTIKQSAFCSDLKEYYGTHLLKILRSDFDTQCNYEWPRELTRSPRHIIHPIRYILVIRFLCGSFEATKNWFLNTGDNSCSDFKIKKSYYMNNADWQKQFRLLIAEGKTCTEISRILNTHRATVKKYFDMIKSSELIERPNKTNILSERGEKYLNEIKKYIHLHPHTNRKEIREKFYNQYQYLYWRNKEILFSLLSNLEPSKVGGTHPIDWEARDAECLSKLKKLYMDLKEQIPPIRLSKTMLMKHLKCGSIWFHIDKLPKTKEYLMSISEDVPSFQLRKIEFYCKKLLSEKGHICKQAILQTASITPETYSKLATEIQNIITHITENDSKYTGEDI